ncbi:hypothetical protein C1752_00261 [Acaryochloris thomasi RCC1774]|uniref:N-acetyltransferase domain-containing protein n=1 Tax=Acaryochloris thomasi RCC1774 TaxID=1764569 RepID=A0A2W1JPT0_9CYAN|nr:N-acetyltransferase [Acaryochloris thomasi]PZD75350.1 hypothetical protein C1752_00261 [Acaryochloris thomasi RCC1774]
MSQKRSPGEETIIRPERISDVDAIWSVNQQTFETEAEANLVNALRKSASPYLSFVAERGSTVIGHLLLTPVDLVGECSKRKLMGLAPMAVLPAAQRQGIGSQLIKAGITACRRLEYDAIVVLGYPSYYPRFGFVPASLFDIHSSYEVPDDAFMILALSPSCLSDVHGIIQYHEAFRDL